jgi:molybdopterin synthase sulfur carrier subunit
LQEHIGVHVKGYVTFRELVGERWISLEEDRSLSIRELLRALCEQDGQALTEQLFDAHSGALKAHVAILVNGRSISNLPEGLDSLLTDQDEVAIFPPLMGGNV